MYRLVILQFLRNKMTLIALLLLLIVGLISLLEGKRFLNRQQKAIQETAAYQKEHIARLVKYESKEMGLLLYYLKFAYINPTSPLAGLSIGQRDINSSIQTLTIRGLEGQKYDTDIRNPYQLMTGHLDLSFVVIYLFPLVIIILCFNLYSEEHEQGTWSLVTAQSKNSRGYLLQKITVPFILVTGVLLLLYSVAAILLSIPISASFISYMVSNFLYIVFWFAVALLVVSFFRSSTVNAIALLSIWLLLTLLLPAAFNNFVTQKYPVPEALRTMIKQRDGYHKKWDIPKDSTMIFFAKEYPQYAAYKWTGEGFNWLWYYAMQHLGDANAKPDQSMLIQNLMHRENRSRQFSFFIPTLYAQLYNNSLAQSSLQQHLQFLDSTTQFHERLRMYFYPKIFTNTPVNHENWNHFTPVYCRIAGDDRWSKSLHLAWFSFIFVIISLYRLKKAS
jgi:ABC-2 type transport system permease protein